MLGFWPQNCEKFISVGSTTPPTPVCGHLLRRPLETWYLSLCQAHSVNECHPTPKTPQWPPQWPPPWPHCLQIHPFSKLQPPRGFMKDSCGFSCLCSPSPQGLPSTLGTKSQLPTQPPRPVPTGYRLLLQFNNLDIGYIGLISSPLTLLVLICQQTACLLLTPSKHIPLFKPFPPTAFVSSSRAEGATRVDSAVHGFKSQLWGLKFSLPLTCCMTLGKRQFLPIEPPSWVILCLHPGQCLHPGWSLHPDGVYTQGSAYTQDGTYTQDGLYTQDGANTHDGTYPQDGAYTQDGVYTQMASTPRAVPPSRMASSTVPRSSFARAVPPHGGLPTLFYWPNHPSVLSLNASLGKLSWTSRDVSSTVLLF
uniref:uncharacterized protein LOC118149689 n=1 Tax=Callithrix jacchus TaxID=9483 RepID=UPI0023DCF306|nr:uncharacterized protein LOC118149689 [Callithrix jacchus]XP_035137724.2 uncharacterized protein LOC118149689 [Callithrix jacchus]